MKWLVSLSFIIRPIQLIIHLISLELSYQIL